MSRARAALVGAAGGAASGLLGIGGGVVMVPLLVALLGLDQKVAHGTSLAIVVFTAIAAAAVYLASGPVDLALAALLSAGAVFGARFGAHATTRMTSLALKRAFGALLLVLALRLAFAGGSALTSLPDSTLGVAISIAIGFVVGWLSGLLGVGGGTILVPILVIGFGLAQHQAQGVSLVMVVPTAIAGAWSHRRLGQVERRVVPPAALASIVTGALFAAIAHLVSGPVLRTAFAIVLGITGARMLFARAPRAAADSAAAGSHGTERGA